MTIEQHNAEQLPTGASTTGDEVDPTPERQPRGGLRIYVASLSDYNDGVLHGAWINADQEADELHGDVGAMLRESIQPWAEEWAIHDYVCSPIQSGHRFRSNPDTDSDPIRTPIPEDSGHLRAVRG
jgi:hypothetical protein